MLARAAKPVRGVQPKQPVALNLHPHVAPLRHNVHLAADSGSVRGGGRRGAICSAPILPYCGGRHTCVSYLASWLATGPSTSVYHKLRSSMSHDGYSKRLSLCAANGRCFQLGRQPWATGVAPLASTDVAPATRCRGPPRSGGRPPPRTAPTRRRPAQPLHPAHCWPRPAGTQRGLMPSCTL